MLYILAVLVVVFANVAEVRRKGLNSQGTWDLPAFPLNDHTCHKHIYHTLKVRDIQQRNEIPLKRLLLSRLCGHLANNQTGERKRIALLYTREVVQVRLVTIYVYSLVPGELLCLMVLFHSIHSDLSEQEMHRCNK